jgi:hypothetical protein
MELSGSFVCCCVCWRWHFYGSNPLKRSDLEVARLGEKSPLDST